MDARLNPRVEDRTHSNRIGTLPACLSPLEASPAVALAGPYQVRLAATPAEVRAAQRLRFEVFNLELGEGLAESMVTGHDADAFDAVCDHLIVEHLELCQVVGTYRLQTGTTARRHLGFYSDQEFDLTPFIPLGDRLLELGRACVQQAHRNVTVLGLLWKGIAACASRHGARYLVGCSSLTSVDPAVGATVYANLYRRHIAPLQWRTQPRGAAACCLDRLLDEAPPVPKLLRAYLSLGAWICGPPAIDREFGTIDFLTLLDLDGLSAPVRARFFGRLPVSC
ncbi:MAG: GNAT family N-acetyltransferase [Verrucomicrobiales bacterium]|nr:GNAT family N-acetyltransferase [Verrucomicrobiales bacterium]